ncbi:hypothetical protein BOX15_Mlig006834g1 [Macrostomum lignano]|uniref:Uncharacterized protein n=1 Tax=Macrostomum lignano TaxID=282301 RepID=A0A267EEG9_9PLAT|nr:hypothetical protein BOX15_Mlig006834g1 [Macrostomum lignano]
MDKAKQQLLRVVGRNERWEAGIREFVETWRALSGYLATRGARFPDAIFPITLHAHPADEMRLAALLPHNGVWGRCIVGLVQLLMEAQNAVLDASGVHCDEIDICQADAASMISYDPDSDLLPALLANSAYSLRPGRGCQVAYNFAGLQQQLTELLVRGRLRLTGHLPQMLYKEEFNLMEQFLLLDQAVPQCRSPSSSMVSHALSSELPSSPPVITSLLEELLPPAVSFLTSLAPKEPSQLLHDFMTKSLRMPQGLPEPLNRCVTIDHVRLLWLSLDRLRCQQLADDGFEPFRDCCGLEAAPLEEPLRELLPPRDLRNRRSLLLEKLHSLMRLELASRPDLLDLPLSEVGDLYTDYDGVFDGWDERLLCKHSAAIWMTVFALEGSRA